MADFYQLLLHEFKLPFTNPVLIFSLVLLIILLSPILLKRLNIPGIIGLIVSGVIVGPFGLNILEKSSAVELFSTIGLLYIMFIAGLDLDLNEFIANRNKSIVFGFLTFIIPLSIGFPVCYYLFEYNFNASLLISSMFSTHTLIAYPIVSRLGVARNQAVAITVGGTILTDTAVLLIFAIIMGNTQGALNLDFWINLGVSLIVFSAILFFLIPKIANWFFHKLEGEKHAHYIFVLTIVFFSAFLAELSGVEPIIGAFVAGLALNRLIPHSSALMNRIEFIGNSLFIPFFLISVGMIVDLNVVFSGPMALLIAGTLTIIALFSKWLAAFITRILFKFSKMQGLLIFGLSSSHAAATLAIILVGYNANVIDKNILNGTIILILITCIVASMVTDKVARNIAINTIEEENAKPNLNVDNKEHILLPIANNSNFKKLLEFAFLIKDKKSRNPISILTILPNNEDAEKNIIISRNQLQAFVNEASASEINVNIITAIDYNATSGISRTIKEILANIIILGRPELQDISNKLIGDKLESIIHGNNKTALVCYFKQALVKLKQVSIIAPPLSEKEIGFGSWLSIFARVSQEFTARIVFFGNSCTIEATIKQIKMMNSSILIKYRSFIDWEEFVNQPSVINPEDLLVLVSSRKGALSFTNNLEKSLLMIEHQYKSNNRIIIYPEQFEQIRN